MTLPANLQTITVTGTYLDTTGVPLSGTISFTPPPELVDVATAIMYAAPVTATLTAQGTFSVTLICTDNGTLSPAGWSYTVKEAISGNRSYTIYVPHTLGATIDISSLVPLPTLTGAPTPPTVAAIAPGYGALAYDQTWTGINTFDGAVDFASAPTVAGGSLDPLDWVNVKTYGALGDGATDDTTAIQAALTACPRGGVVYFPAGVYRTSAPLIQQPYTTCRFTHGSGQFQMGGASPYSSIKPLPSFAGAAVWRILDEQLGGFAAPTILAEGNSGPYQVVSAEYTIEGMSIDGSALVAANVNGIDILGQVQDVYLRDVDVQQVTGDGINSTYNFAVTAGPQAPFAIHFARIAVQQCTGTGIVLSNATDSTFADCYVLGCGSFGWWIAWPGNSIFTACRAEWSSLDGFHVTAQGGQTLFSGCSTDRNGSNGFYITGTGTTPGVVNLSGCILNRDGRNSGGGGGNFAGLAVASTNSAVIADGITILPGVDDDGTKTLSPEYGVSLTSAPLFSITGSMVNAATSAFHDGGSNTTVLYGPNIVEAVGNALGTTGPGIQSTRTGATVNGTLNVTGATTLAGANAGGQKITNVANGTASTDVAAFGQIPTSLAPSGTAGGDLTGTYPNPTLSGTANVESIIRANRLDQLAAPSASVPMNTQKFTGLANGSAATDSAAFGQIPLVDATAAHIQPLGVQAAGSNGKWADSGHVHAYSSGILTAPVTVTGVTANTLIFGGPTLAAGTVRAGMIYTFEAWGQLSTAASANTVLFGLYWGGISGTTLCTVGPSQPNSSAAASNVSWKYRFSVIFQSTTQAAASCEDCLSYFYTSENQGGVVTISNASAQQLVIGMTPNASGVSVTAYGGFWHQKG